MTMQSTAAKYIKGVFFTVIVLLSAATSFLYFVEVFSFGRGLLEDTLIAVLLNGLIGVTVLDAAAIAWLKIYLGASDNNELRTFAAAGMIVAMIGSALSSLAYLLMVSSGYVIPPKLATYTQWAMAGIIVFHFVLVFLSAYRATQARIDEKAAEMLSEAQEEMLKLTEQEFRLRIPDLAKTNADALTRLLAGRFASLSSLQLPKQQALPTPSEASSGQPSPLEDLAQYLKEHPEGLSQLEALLSQPSRPAANGHKSGDFLH